MNLLKALLSIDKHVYPLFIMNITRHINITLDDKNISNRLTALLTLLSYYHITPSSNSIGAFSYNCHAFSDDNPEISSIIVQSIRESEITGTIIQHTMSKN